MIKSTEVKSGDRIVFNHSSGKGSVVRTKNKGYFFMPSKLGMRISGEKSPIARNEIFVFNTCEILDHSINRVLKCYLTRCKDNVQFAISENELMNYFSKPDARTLGILLKDE